MGILTGRKRELLTFILLKVIAAAEKEANRTEAVEVEGSGKFHTQRNGTGGQRCLCWDMKSFKRFPRFLSSLGKLVILLAAEQI